MAITTIRQSLFNLQELMEEVYQEGNMVEFNRLMAREQELLMQVEQDDLILA